MKALITGASSGIGEAFAEKLAQQGYDLILTGRREDKLNTISHRLRKKYNINIELYLVELSNDREVELLADKIRKTANLQVLINNAGFGSSSPFLNGSFKGPEKMVKVHILAPLKLIYAALPGLQKMDNSILINVSSLSSRTPLPTGAMYSATKSFIRIFSEALYLENIHSNIKIQTLCPGFTRTDFHEKMGLNNSSLKNRGIVRWMTPDEVVDISLKSLKKGQVVCVPGFWNKVLWYIADLIPRNLYYRLVTKVGKRQSFFIGEF